MEIKLHPLVLSISNLSQQELCGTGDSRYVSTGRHGVPINKGFLKALISIWDKKNWF